MANQDNVDTDTVTVTDGDTRVLDKTLAATETVTVTETGSVWEAGAEVDIAPPMSIIRYENRQWGDL